MESNKLVDRLLSVLEEEVLPLTIKAVDQGNKVFGAAILSKADLDLVVAGANEETVNPLFHGEISTLNRYWAIPSARRPAPQECIFLSSHEPCSLCLSAITFCGFDNFYYFFSYEDSRDTFAIPHDLNILHEVFRCSDGNYAAENDYWRSCYLGDLIERGPVDRQPGWKEKVATLNGRYHALSDQYQRSKDQRAIPLP